MEGINKKLHTSDVRERLVNYINARINYFSGGDEMKSISESITDPFIVRELESLRGVINELGENLNIPDVSDGKIQRVKALKDESCHWYIIPNDLYQSFIKDEQDEDLVDSGEFDNKYGKYRTGGDLNLVQLYAEI